jgi:GTPase involved in cell partitioning and DNA repair
MTKTTSEELADLKATVREAHEVIKDARQLIKELKQYIDKAEVVVHNTMDNEVMAELEDLMGNYTSAIVVATAEAENRVYEKFAKITQVLLIEDQSAQKAGMPTLEEALGAIAATDNAVATVLHQRLSQEVTGT